jgi:dTDP-4-amino-4,6-dideoxygalactose transaminase
MIPQVDLKSLYQAHKPLIEKIIQEVLEKGIYVLGPQVSLFEKAFAQWVGRSHALGVANGTDAIELCLRACEVGPGHLVMTVAHTAVATVSAIERVGAIPVFVDVDPRTMTMDPVHLEERLAQLPQKPQAIIPVHLYGHMADMPRLNKIAETHDLWVIEDCAQAHGALWRSGEEERRAGQWGDMAAFSFYPTKNLGALGDGGAVVTSNSFLAERVALLRQYGWRERNKSELPGINSRLDELQAGILMCRLSFLDRENQARRDRAALYDQALETAGGDILGGGLIKPFCRPENTHVYHQYVVQVEGGQRESFQEYLKEKGIGTAIHYPIPVHQQPAYGQRLPHACPLPVTEALASKIVSLPLYPYLSLDNVAYISSCLQSWIKKDRVA